MKWLRHSNTPSNIARTSRHRPGFLKRPLVMRVVTWAKFSSDGSRASSGENFNESEGSGSSEAGAVRGTGPRHSQQGVRRRDDECRVHRRACSARWLGLTPSTSTQIAEAASLQERYQNARVARRDGDGGRCRARPGNWDLPSAARARGVFDSRRPDPTTSRTLAQLIPLIGNVEDEIVECFRNGGGVPYSSFKRFPEVMRELSAPTFDVLLVSKILPLVPGLVEALAGGLDVLEVGCGSGRALNVMAAAFPLSRFVQVRPAPGTDRYREGRSARPGPVKRQFRGKRCVGARAAGAFPLGHGL